MLTPDVVKSKSFQATGRGAYRAEDVDGFFAEVSASYEQMFKENGELIKKISILANKVEQYKEEEDSLRRALISAQTLADKIVKDARESVEGTLEQATADADEMRAKASAEAAEIVEKAKAEAEAVILQSKKDADEILGSVNRKVMKESLEFEMLQKKAAEFRANLLGLYKEHLNLINAIPEYVEKEMPVFEKEEVSEAQQVAETPAEATLTEESAQAAEQTEEAAAEPTEQEVAVSAEAVAEFEDVSSSSEEDAAQETEPDSAEDDGFSLDLSAFAEAEEETASADEVQSTRTYAVAQEEAETEDEGTDMDDPVSFKSFFKKK